MIKDSNKTELRCQDINETKGYFKILIGNFMISKSQLNSQTVSQDINAWFHPRSCNAMIQDFNKTALRSKISMTLQ